MKRTRQEMSPLVRGSRRRPPVPVQTAADAISEFHTMSLRLSSKLGMCRVDVSAFNFRMGGTLYYLHALRVCPKTLYPHSKSLFCGHAILRLASFYSSLSLQRGSAASTPRKTSEPAVGRFKDIRTSPCQQVCTTIWPRLRRLHLSRALGLWLHWQHLYRLTRRIGPNFIRS